MNQPPDKRTLLRSLARRAALPLACGLFVSVLVAWTISTALDNSWFQMRTKAAATTSLVLRDRPEAHLWILKSKRSGFTDWSLQRLTLVRSPGKPFTYIDSLPFGQGLEAPDDQFRWVTSFGLPFRCLARQHDMARVQGLLSSSQPQQASSQLVLPNHQLIIALPVRVLWPGLLLNTLFYASLAAAFVILLRQTRRHLRLRRGHCPFCNYDLRGAFSRPCSECGGIASASRSLRST